MSRNSLLGIRCSHSSKYIGLNKHKRKGYKKWQSDKKNNSNFCLRWVSSQTCFGYKSGFQVPNSQPHLDAIYKAQNYLSRIKIS